jgi:glycosyltransferase involved in cell wall biosynthesis
MPGKKKYTFIPNGIDLERFSFRPQARETIRKTLGVADNFVIGHAGRFSAPKNHIYLIDVFHELKKVCPDAVLLLFGTGELMESVQAHVDKLDLTESVRFMGATDQLEDMYQAMDVFVMPSLGEGLPVAGVEAQTSGLPTILSDTITREVAVTDCITYLPLSQDKSQWVDTILSYRGYVRRSRCEELREAGFDEKEVAKYFQKYYLELDIE